MNMIIWQVYDGSPLDSEQASGSTWFETRKAARDWMLTTAREYAAAGILPRLELTRCETVWNGSKRAQIVQALNCSSFVRQAQRLAEIECRGLDDAVEFIDGEGETSYTTPQRIFDAAESDGGGYRLPVWASPKQFADFEESWTEYADEPHMRELRELAAAVIKIRIRPVTADEESETAK